MFRKPKIITDEKIIDEILERSVSAIYPEKESLKKSLMSGKRLKIYAGADATGSQLHLGHSTNLIFLEKFRQLGHEIIILFGNFTAKIGDPTDKGAARVRLNDKQVNENIKTWKKQISKIVNFSEANKPKIVYNADWLAKLSFEDLIDLSANFTVQQMLERDMFEKRMQEGKPIYMHEFFYPLMQGYDSVHLDVDLEIGGNDQTFNMLAGRTLLSKLKNKNKFVLATTLLENPVTGKKIMNKSEGGFVALDDSATDMFGKVMALPDEVIIPMFRDTTFVPVEKISEYQKQLEGGANPRDLKIILAKEIVKIYHGEGAGEKAEQDFLKTFSQKEGMPEDAPEIKINSGTLLSDKLVEIKMIPSKSEWRRLIESGAVSDVDSGEKISDPNYSPNKNINLKIGKKKFVKVIVE